MKLSKFFWPIVGSAAVVFSIWLLYHELRGVSLEEMAESFSRVSLKSWLLAILSTLVAYAALAGYDRIALRYLGKKVPWLFIAVGSFTTYAISHNVGASVLSGAVVRYRAYGSKGLSMGEVGVLVAFCSFTFALGVLFLTGMVFVIEPEIADRFVDMLPTEYARATGYILLGLIALYVAGSFLKLPPLRIKGFRLDYPSPPIISRQLVIGPIEIIGAAGIVYFALPEAGNPGFLVILGIFLISFSVALLSHAPGGLGVLELVFVHALSEMDPADVIAALVVFRLLYLVIPFVIALGVILVFEHSRFGKEEA